MVTRFLLSARRRAGVVVALAALFAAFLRATSSADGQGSAAVGIPSHTLTQINAILAEKATRTPTQQKIDSRLLYAARMVRGVEVAPGIARIQATPLPTEAGRVVLDVRAQVSEGLLAELRALGADVVSSHPAFDEVRIRVNLESIESIAALAAVRFIQPRQEGLTNRDDSAVRDAGLAAASGGAASQGDQTHLAAVMRARYGVDGSGVKIGVLSDGVFGLAASQASGDLGPVTVLPGQAGSGAEGTAMLEIIHDLAPGADLYFATAFNGIASFAQNVQALRAAGCDIIVDDVSYPEESPFQDGQTYTSPTNGAKVIQAVKDVVASGALFFSAAGNSGRKNAGWSGTWEGDFVDAGPSVAPLPLGRLHQFGGGQVDNILLAAGVSNTLHWSDPLGGSANDYDLIRIDQNGFVADLSTNTQNGDDDPYETVTAGSPGDRLVVVKFAGAPRFLHLSARRGRLSLSTDGAIVGHPATTAVNSFAVAATRAQRPGPHPAPFNGSNRVETFSSDGPRRIFFTEGGAAITPGNVSSSGGQVLSKPDFAAADGVTVTGHGGFSTTFFGTSAAAPHVAALAALIKSAHPGFSASAIRGALVAGVIDVETPGLDQDSGLGIVIGEGLGLFSKVGPANGTTQSSVNPTLSWAPSEGATNYQYCIDRTNNNQCDGQWTSVGNRLSVAISGLAGGTTYYWQVRAQHGIWTEAANASAVPPLQPPAHAPGQWWTLNISGAWPGALGKTEPANSVTGQPLSIQLKWEPFVDATNYYYCLDTIDNNSCDDSWWPFNFSYPNPLNIWPSETVIAGTKYYWQVLAVIGGSLIKGANAGQWFTFETVAGGGGPGMFVKTNPAQFAAVSGSNVTLSWSPSFGAWGYEYCIDTTNNNLCDSGYWWPVVQPAAQPEIPTSAAISGLAGATTYYWQVRAWSDVGTIEGAVTEFPGVWSRFTTGPVPPGPFRKASPQNGAGSQTTNVTLAWEPSADATSYSYCYDTIDNDTCDGGWHQAGSNLTASLSGLSVGTRYYWQVEAQNTTGTSVTDSPTSWWTFTTHGAPGPNLLQNGGFLASTSGWLLHATPDPSYIVSNVTNGVFQFYRVPPPPGTSNQAVIFQETGMTLQAGEALRAQFELGNSSSVRKRISVLVLDANFSDLAVCTFWLPPNTPLQAYEMRTHSTKAWTNAAIYFYAATAGSDGGFYLLDNVSLRSDPGVATDQVDCVDPEVPPASGGVDGVNLLSNGDFTSGLSFWTFFGQIVHQIIGGVFEFYRPSGTPAGVVLQVTGQPLASGDLLTATLRLGNSSPVRKRVTVLVHDADFTDLAACTFWLEPSQSLSSYAMRMFTTKAWVNATVSVYPSTVGIDQWIQLDNVALRQTPSNAILGTECLEPTSAGSTSLLTSLATSQRVIRGAETRFQSAARSDGTPPPAGEPSPETGLTSAAIFTTDASTVQVSTLIDLRGATGAVMTLDLPPGEYELEVDAGSEATGVRPLVRLTHAGKADAIQADLVGLVGQVWQLKIVFRPASGDDFDDRTVCGMADFRISVERIR